MSAISAKALILSAAILLFLGSGIGPARGASTPATRPAQQPVDAPPPLAPGTLSGTVVDAHGHPVARSKVVYQDYNESLQKVATRSEAVTDAAGHFHLGPLAPVYRHRYDLEIEADGLGHQYVPGGTYSIYPGVDSDLGRIQVEKGRVFSGQVLDWDGKPVGGADVEYSVLRLAAGHGIAEVTPKRKLSTDPMGRFRTPPLPVGLLSIDVYVRERQRAGWGFQPIVPGGEEELRPVRLKKEVPIAGTVHDEQGRPIAGAVISASDLPDTRSNDAGQFVLHGFGPDPDFQVQVIKPEYVMINWVVKQTPEGLRYEEVGPGSRPWVGPMRRLDFVMQSEAWVQGRAIDEQTGTPMHLDRVVICHFSRLGDGQIMLSSCYNADFQQPRPGEFRASYASASEYHLTFSAHGYDDAEAFTPKVDRLQPINGLVVKMRRQAGAEKASVRSQRISGMVTRDGQPVKTGWVGLWAIRDPENIVNTPMMRGRTVERERIVFGSAPINNGTYTLDVPNPGDGWYVVAEEAGRAISQVGPIKVAAGERKSLDIRCVEGGTISGHVDDIPAAWNGSVWVVAFNRTGVRGEARVGADGRFTLANLPPGEYGLKAGYDGFRDSEVPKELSRQDWETPAQPWRRATVVNVGAARETADVRVVFPAD